MESEKAEFNFPEDWTAWVPYVRDGQDSFEKQFKNSFENYYEHIKLSAWNPTRLAFLPLVVDAFDGVKVLITETDLRDYPGLYLNGKGGTVLKGSSYPCEYLVTVTDPGFLCRNEGSYLGHKYYEGGLSEKG